MADTLHYMRYGLENLLTLYDCNSIKMPEWVTKDDGFVSNKPIIPVTLHSIPFEEWRLLNFKDTNSESEDSKTQKAYRLRKLENPQVEKSYQKSSDAKISRCLDSNSNEVFKNLSSKEDFCDLKSEINKETIDNISKQNSVKSNDEHDNHTKEVENHALESENHIEKLEKVDKKVEIATDNENNDLIILRKPDLLPADLNFKNNKLDKKRRNASKSKNSNNTLEANKESTSITTNDALSNMIQMAEKIKIENNSSYNNLMKPVLSHSFENNYVNSNEEKTKKSITTKDTKDNSIIKSKNIENKKPVILSADLNFKNNKLDKKRRNASKSKNSNNTLEANKESTSITSNDALSNMIQIAEKIKIENNSSYKNLMKPVLSPSFENNYVNSNEEKTKKSITTKDTKDNSIIKSKNIENKKAVISSDKKKVPPQKVEDKSNILSSDHEKFFQVRSRNKNASRNDESTKKISKNNSNLQTKMLEEKKPLKQNVAHFETSKKNYLENKESTQQHFFTKESIHEKQFTTVMKVWKTNENTNPQSQKILSIPEIEKEISKKSLEEENTDIKENLDSLKKWQTAISSSKPLMADTINEVKKTHVNNSEPHPTFWGSFS